MEGWEKSKKQVKQFFFGECVAVACTTTTTITTSCTPSRRCAGRSSRCMLVMSRRDRNLLSSSKLDLTMKILFKQFYKLRKWNWLLLLNKLLTLLNSQSVLFINNVHHMIWNDIIFHWYTFLNTLYLTKIGVYNLVVKVE